MKKITDYNYFYNFYSINVISVILSSFYTGWSLYYIKNSVGHINITLNSMIFLLFMFVFIYILSILILSAIDYGIRTILEAFSIKGNYGVVVKIILTIAIISLVVKILTAWR